MHLIIKFFTFNTTKIEYNNEYIIYFVDLNEIYLISIKNKTWMIIGIVIGSVGFISIVVLGIYLYKKKHKKDIEPSIRFNSGKKRHYNDRSSDNLHIGKNKKIIY